MATHPRVPFGSRDPFTALQFEGLKRVFIACAAVPRREAEILFVRHWPELVAEAAKCDQQLAIQKTRKPDRNHFRPLREAARRGDVDWLLSKHPEHADSLLYGAIRAGVAEDYDDLPGLDRAQVKAAVVAALSPGSVIMGRTGRRKGGPLEDYARYLASLYHKIRGSKATSSRYDAGSGERRGPAIEFFQAALAPIPHSLSTHGIRKLIERAAV